MPTIIDRDMLRNLRAPIEEALAEVAEKFNITIKCGNGMYASTNGTMKLVFGLRDGGKAAQKEFEDCFKVYAPLDGIPMHLLGQTCSQGYTLVGYNQRKRSRAYMLERNGKKYVSTPMQIKYLFAEEIAKSKTVKATPPEEIKIKPAKKTNPKLAALFGDED